MSTNKSKCKNEGKKRNDDMALMWLNWSIATINATLQLLDIYRQVCINLNYDAEFFKFHHFKYLKFHTLVLIDKQT